MSSYGGIARWYDLLTADVRYEEFANFYCRVFNERAVEPSAILDLGCGTGRLAEKLLCHGFELIAVDASPDMLSIAAWRMEKYDEPALLLCQRMTELDLYGTVDAAVSSLDSFNYLEPCELPEVLKRLRMFIAPGGILIFDILTPRYMQELDGEVFFEETEELFCIWRAGFNTEEMKLVYEIDYFESEANFWRRGFEEHIEYAYELEDINKCLIEAGFSDIEFKTDITWAGEGRVFVIAKNS